MELEELAEAPSDQEPWPEHDSGDTSPPWVDAYEV